MRIALLTYSTKPRGGVVHTLSLAEALARLGHEVTVWTLGRGGDRVFYRAVDPAVDTRMVEFPPIEGEEVGPRIMRSIRVLSEAFAASKDAYDVVHAQDCISANAVGRCIRTIHHLDQFTTPELARCHDRAITAPYAHICVSRSVADEVRRGWGLEPTVIPNGVDFDRFHDVDPAAVADWADRLGHYVLAVGGIEPRKGSIDLVRAFAGARDRATSGEGALDPGIRLVIGGGETLFDYRPYRAEFERECGRLGVEPVVLGTLDQEQMAPLVAAADRFAFLSTKEGFGLAAMEALAAGVPLIARELPVLREIFDGGARFGRTIEQMADALLAPPDPTLTRGGIDLARHYSWDAAAAAHVDFYQAHLQRSAATGHAR